LHVLFLVTIILEVLFLLALFTPSNAQSCRNFTSTPGVFGSACTVYTCETQGTAINTNCLPSSECGYNYYCGYDGHFCPGPPNSPLICTAYPGTWGYPCTISQDCSSPTGYCATPNNSQFTQGPGVNTKFWAGYTQAQFTEKVCFGGLPSPGAGTTSSTPIGTVYTFPNADSRLCRVPADCVSSGHQCSQTGNNCPPKYFMYNGVNTSTGITNALCTAIGSCNPLTKFCEEYGIQKYYNDKCTGCQTGVTNYC